jgi:trimethylamine--corrinoid protein Co-methyltransferase
LAGANQIYGAGMIESGVTFDFGQLVMDNEIARMIKVAVGGIPVTDHSLAVDEIVGVGAFGDFLSLDSTLRHMRDLSQPVILDRRVREDWEAQGSRDLATVARAKALELVEAHEPTPLDADVARQIRSIVEAADRERGVA